MFKDLWPLKENVHSLQLIFKAPIPNQSPFRALYGEMKLNERKSK